MAMRKALNRGMVKSGSHQSFGVRAVPTGAKVYPWWVSSDVIQGTYSVMRQIGEFARLPRFEVVRDRDGGQVRYSTFDDALRVAGRLNGVRP